LEDFPISKVHTKEEHMKKRFIKSSSMQDLFDRTEDNEKPYSKFTDLKFPISKIFSGLPPTPVKKGVRRLSITNFSNLSKNDYKDNYNTNNPKQEINFHNIHNQKYFFIFIKY